MKIMLIMLSGVRINYNNSSILVLVTSIMIMAILMIHYNTCICILFMLVSMQVIHNYPLITLMSINAYETYIPPTTQIKITHIFNQCPDNNDN